MLKSTQWILDALIGLSWTRWVPLNNYISCLTGTYLLQRLFCSLAKFSKLPKANCKLTQNYVFSLISYLPNFYSFFFLSAISSDFFIGFSQVAKKFEKILNFFFHILFNQIWLIVLWISNSVISQMWKKKPLEPFLKLLLLSKFTIYWTFNEEINQYSRTFAPQVQAPWNQVDDPLLLKSFPKRPRMRSEASQFNGSHKYKTNKIPLLHRWTSVACAVGPSVSPLQNKETQHVNIVLQCMYQFFKQPNMKGNHVCIEWQAFKCYHVFNWFFLSKPSLLEFIWIFSSRNHLKIKYLPHSESKSYQINSIKSCSSKSFQQHQRHTPIPPKFLVTI